MTARPDRLGRVLEDIDRFNAEDPRREGGVALELAYARRLTDWVLRLRPEASEALRIAARGQHAGRWMVPRDRYEMTRGGYLRWREDLKRLHADTVARLMAGAGYGQEEVERVRALILKKNIAADPEAQALEDALCLVFLETQFEDLKARTEDDKMREIVRKTWRKMGPRGREEALRLSLPAPAKQFLTEALAE